MVAAGRLRHSGAARRPASSARLPGWANQAAQDANAATLNPGAAAERAVCKSGALYNCSWDLVDARTEADFDPPAKYHVPASVPYMRYFLASILQFQFHRALCKVAGHEGPLHTCSIYGNKAAGERLWKTLQAGASQPWQDTLFAMTGERQMDASAILDYFGPLAAWLEEQTKGLACGY